MTNHQPSDPFDFGAGEIAKLKADLAEAQKQIQILEDPIKQVYLKRMEIGDGAFAAEMESGMITVIMAQFVELFRMQNAVNYIGWEAEQGGEKYTLTFQRLHGENPANKAARLESELTSERTAREQIKGSLFADEQRQRTAGERCGVTYDDHGCDWPEWVADALIGERAKVATADRIIGQLGNDKAALENVLNSERAARERFESECRAHEQSIATIGIAAGAFKSDILPRTAGLHAGHLLAVVEATCAAREQAEQERTVLIEKLAEEQAQFMQSIDRNSGGPHWADLTAEEQADRIARYRRGIIADLPAWVETESSPHD